jgi:hypothetical protein
MSSKKVVTSAMFNIAAEPSNAAEQGRAVYQRRFRSEKFIGGAAAMGNLLGREKAQGRLSFVIQDGAMPLALPNLRQACAE